MRKSYKLIVYLLLSFCGVITLQAQNKPSLTKPIAAKSETVFIHFPFQKNSLKNNQDENTIKQYLGLGKDSRLVNLQIKTDQSGFTHSIVQQYHKGIKVEYGSYKIVSKNGVLSSISGEKYLVEEINNQPSLSAEAALQKALHYVGAQTYKWQIREEEQWLKNQKKNIQATYYPSAELVYCKVAPPIKREEANSMALAYKFDIYAHEPLSRAYIYVDAHNGNIIHTNAIIKHVNGLAATRYSGDRNIDTQKTDTTYHLRDYSRGSGIETYNLNNEVGYLGATNFSDNDNNWTAAEFANSNKDDAALDAHWGAMMTYDYFNNVHGRNSFDGNGSTIKNYVHYSDNYPNAFWNGSVMTYGDGGKLNGVTVQPFTTLDIVAHEIGHAICEHTAGLVYSYESGALNEGFSDIWAATIENYAAPSKKTWMVGEDINVALRSMSSPNDYEQPDTYLGKHWYTGQGDYGGVHTNSGVLNHWFYLLSIGKSGVNDNGDSYTVTGIGVEKAAKIAYHTETVYLTANSVYQDARKFSVQAAVDLFGATSDEALQTANAWYAVGVYDTETAPSELIASVLNTTQVKLSWKDNSATEAGYLIERSLTSGQDFVPVATVKANVTGYTDINIASNNVYYYRVRGIIGSLHSGFSNEVNAILGYATIVMSTTKIVTCQGVFLDPGGDKDYNTNTKSTMTFSPSTAGTKLKVEFSSFDLENNFDYLIVYDGDNIQAPFIGRYAGTTLPPTITATNAAGQLTFYFVSDDVVNKPGWIATISCSNSTPPPPVITSFAPISGTPGTTVIITGANFTATTSVMFNNTPAQFTVNSDTQITALVPATAAKGSISITSQGGTKKSATDFIVTPIITISGLTYTFDGTAKEAVISTVPNNLPVSITYNNTVTPPVNAGNYEVIVSIADSNYTGSATANLVINKAKATIMLSQLEQVYNGTSKVVAATTIPTGLSVSLVYDNLRDVPAQAGTYEVSAQIIDKNYEGSANETLLITKAEQTINFDALEDKTFGDAGFTLNAKASSLLPITFSVVKGPAIISKNVVNLTGAGQVIISASQPGDNNFKAATIIEKTMCVKPAKPVIISSGTDTDAIFTLVSSSPNGNQWLLNGLPIAEATSQTLNVTKPGTYSLVVTAGQCQNISDEVVLTSSQSEEVLSTGIQVFPNPATDKITLHVHTLKKSGELIATIYSNLGEKVIQQTISQQIDGWQTNLFIKHLPVGRYIIYITDGKQKYSKTFIKQ